MISRAQLPDFAERTIALVLLRVVIALDLQRRLTPNQSHWATAWLVPIKDLLGAILWLAAFLGNTIEWRGHRMRLRPDGTILPDT